MRNIFHPILLSLDNEMEIFWQDYKHKIANQGRGIAPLTESTTVSDERVSGTVEGHGLQSSERSQSVKVPVEASPGRSEYQASSADSQSLCKPTGNLWSDAHMRFHFPDQAEAQFMEDGARLQKQFPRKRFSVAGVIAVLAVAAFVMWFVYCSMEAF